MLCKNRLKSDKIKENQGIKIHEYVFFRWRAQGMGDTRQTKIYTKQFLPYLFVLFKQQINFRLVTHNGILPDFKI